MQYSMKSSLGIFVFENTELTLFINSIFPYKRTLISFYSFMPANKVFK